MLSPIRQPVRAGSFYPCDAAGCLETLQTFEAGLSSAHRAALSRSSQEKVYGGIVPHAGWSYSGATAYLVFKALQLQPIQPHTIVYFSTSHRSDVAIPSLQSDGSWRTPLGDVPIDAKLTRALLRQAQANDLELLDRAEAHAGDHAIEVLLPMMKALLPEALFVPIAMPLTDRGVELGRLVAEVAHAKDQNVVVLASTDLTHYGPNYYRFCPQGIGLQAHAWAKRENDAPFLKLLQQLKGAEAYRFACRHRCACGPAAAAAATGFAQYTGATRGELLEHITSWEKEGYSETPSDFVGYAALLFV